MSRLTGRTCLITGASSGFGAHFSKILAQQGARVVLGGRRADRVEKLAADINASGGQALPIAMDVTDEASTIAAYDAAETAFGPIDTVIANAGISISTRAIDMSLADLHALLDTNLIGVFLTAREGAKRMIANGSREHGRGRIVLVGSLGAEMSVPGGTAYCASKAGVKSLCRNLALEWARLGINVNAIQPGYIQTELAGDWFESEKGKAQIASFHRRRLQDITSLDEPIIWLCSDASAYITGSVFSLDDGQSL